MGWTGSFCNLYFIKITLSKEAVHQVWVDCAVHFLVTVEAVMFISMSLRQFPFREKSGPPRPRHGEAAVPGQTVVGTLPRQSFLTATVSVSHPYMLLSYFWTLFLFWLISSLEASNSIHLLLAIWNSAYSSNCGSLKLQRTSSCSDIWSINYLCFSLGSFDSY